MAMKAINVENLFGLIVGNKKLMIKAFFNDCVDYRKGYAFLVRLALILSLSL